ncbi:potassium channel family protein [Kitasatospora sp. NPDC058965]|uniref:potassium channel family protein n=1 Tax=Kitasatospora sp. NPDC058965 TaxID=3346682 RepID=UPI0036C9F38D
MREAVRGAPPPAAEQTSTPFAEHYVVCGANALAHRLIVELTEHYKVPVVAVVPDRTQDHGPRIERLEGVAAVLEFGTLTPEALAAAGAAGARGLALVDGDDQSNIHAALTAQGLNPTIRIVLRMFNLRLGEQIQSLLTNCAALSGSATAAPAFANAALARPNSVQVEDRYLYVAYDADPRANHLCVAADRIDPQDLSRMRLLPETPSAALPFIALAGKVDGASGLPGQQEQQEQPEDPDGIAVLQTLPTEPPLRIPLLSRLRYRFLDGLRFFTSARIRLVLCTAFAAVLSASVVIYHFNHSLGWTAYLTLLDMAGSAQPDQMNDPGAGTGGAWQRLAQVVITFSGIALVPVITAVAVDLLASGRRGLGRAPSAGLRGHVIVVGLGNVGTRVATLLHELGVPVAGLERDPQARGVAAVRGLGIPVVVGDGPMSDQLAKVRGRHARAVVAVTSDDAVNLEAALEARALRQDVRMVVRLFDDDFAQHVYATLGDHVASRSVSYLAAPAFAAALMGREVLGTLSVQRHVLLIAELTAAEGSALVGMSRNGIEELDGVRVLAVRVNRASAAYQWSYADRSRGLRVGDQVVVAATRGGLARLNSLAPHALVPARGAG